jgi:hypothetical protein
LGFVLFLERAEAGLVQRNRERENELKIPLSITVKGKEHVWSFNFNGNPEYISDWEEDGLEIYVMANTIPFWIFNLGLTNLYCAIQDLHIDWLHIVLIGTIIYLIFV